MNNQTWTDQLAATVRPLVTFGMFAVFAYLAATGKISAEAVMGVVGTIFGFWFQARSQSAAVAAQAAAVAAAKETK